METNERAERKTQLKKNLKKEKRESVLKSIDSLEKIIKDNQSIISGYTISWRTKRSNE